MSDFKFREVQGNFKLNDRSGEFSFRGEYTSEPMLDPLNTFVGVIVRFYCRQTHDYQPSSEP